MVPKTEPQNDPIEEVTLLSQVAFSELLHNRVAASAEVLVQVQQVLLAQLRHLLTPNALARDSKDLCWAASVLTTDSAGAPRVQETFLIIFSFVFTPKPGVSQGFSIYKKGISKPEIKSHLKCLTEMGAAGELSQRVGTDLV